MLNVKRIFNRLKEEIPDWLANKKYLCLFCGSQPLYLEDTKEDIKCPYPDCDGNTAFSVLVGIMMLKTLEDERKNSIADLNNKALYENMEAIYHETIDALKINPETIIVTFNQVFAFYCNQHNQDLDNLAQSISKISVRGLFGYNSYDFNIDRDLSMICGSNGLGKTTIFKLLEYALVCPQYKQRTSIKSKKDCLDDFELKQRLRWLFELPFDKFIIEFRNGYFVSVEKSRDNKELIFDQTVFGFHSKDSRCVISSNDNIEEMKTHYDNVDKLFPNINKQSKFLFVKTNRLYDLDYSMVFMTAAKRKSFAQLLDKPLISNLFHKKCHSALPSYFSDFYQENFDWSELSMTDYFYYLDKHSNDEVMKRLRNVFDESFKNFNILEAIKYTSIVHAGPKRKYLSDISYNISRKTNQYSSMLNSLTLEKKKEKVISFIFENLLTVSKAEMSNDYFCLQFRRLLDFYDKFTLFKNLYEGLYYDNDPAAKKIDIEGNDIVFKANKTLNNDFSVKLSAKSLSSGELNIVTILYYLIFETTRGSIVLIDEPEISLHVVWQEQLSILMERIMKSKPGVQVIIATHSPFISSSNEESYIGATLVKDERNNGK